MSVPSKESVTVCSAGDLDKLFTNLAHRHFTKWANTDFGVKVCGQLQQINGRREESIKKKWNRVYEFKLENEGAIILDSTLSVTDGFQDSDYVEVTGYPISNVFRNTLTFRLDVVSIRHVDSDQLVAQRRKVVQDLQYLRALKSGTHPFPIQRSVTVGLIHSSSTTAQVDEDFKKALGSESDRCTINAVPVRLSSPEALVGAIKSRENDNVLVIIRGGGEEADFSSFNDPLVLAALAAAPGYRLLGIGHSANVSMADFVCDHSAATPTAAGTHLRDQLSTISQAWGSLEKEAEEAGRKNDRLQDLLAKAQKELKGTQARPVSVAPAVPEHSAWFKKYLPWLIVGVLAIALISH